MMDNWTSGEKLRLVGKIWLVIWVLIMAYLFLNGGSLINQITVSVFVVGCILYMVTYYNPLDYYVHDFGYFTTKVHVTFRFPHNSFPEDIAGVDVQKTEFSGRDESRVIHSQQQYGNTIYKSKVRVNSHDYLQAFYFGFNDEKQRLSYEKIIKDQFKEEKLKNSSTKFYSSGNVLIAFRCYSASSSKKYGFTAYPFSRSWEAWKAARNVNLKSMHEIDEYRIKASEEKKKLELERERLNLERERLNEERRKMFEEWEKSNKSK